MSALYQMRYQGVAGNGHGAMYIGKGVPVSFSLPEGFDDGKYHRVMVGGKPVGVSFNKIGDIP